MKSFVAYPLEFEKMLFPQANSGGKVVAHYELYKKVRHLDGSVIKCGISAEEGFTRFAMFKTLMSNAHSHKMIAFEKYAPNEQDEVEIEFLQHKNNNASITLNNVQQTLKHNGVGDTVDFVPGNVQDSIPNYLIENPELKIAFLNIDLDSYESALTALEYFFPRLIEGGILVSDNYYKKEEEYKAVNTYFNATKMVINNFSVNKGPHYIIR